MFQDELDTVFCNSKVKESHSAYAYLDAAPAIVCVLRVEFPCSRGITSKDRPVSQPTSLTQIHQFILQVVRLPHFVALVHADQKRVVRGTLLRNVLLTFYFAA